MNNKIKKTIRKIKHIFYKQKIINNEIITRILFFKFKKNRRIILLNPDLKYCGKHSYYADNLVVVNKEETKIGSFVSIGKNVQLGHGEHPLNFLSTSPYFYYDELGFKLPNMPTHNEYWRYNGITIENDVWIGDNVFIKNGITVGTGAVIGAGSVVTKNVPEYSIVAGNPAKIIRYRFDEKTINILLESKWWLWDDDLIKQIPYDDISKTIDFLISHKSSKK